MPKRKTQQQFIQEATNIHNTFYFYDKVEYKNVDTKVLITCPIHGDFLQTPKAHTTLHQGCPRCVPEKLKKKGRERALSTEEFVRRASKIYNNKYDYSLVNYKTTHTKVTIICPDHGEYKKTPNQHISAKQGCQRCGNKRSGGIGGYTLTRLNNDVMLASQPASFYVVEFTGDNEHFYKIGISRNSAERRFYISSKMGMKVKILQQYYMSLIDAFTTEQSLLESLDQYKYWPNKRIGGFTECFKPKQQVLSIITEVLDK